LIQREVLCHKCFKTRMNNGILFKVSHFKQSLRAKCNSFPYLCFSLHNLIRPLSIHLEQIHHSPHAPEHCQYAQRKRSQSHNQREAVYAKSTRHPSTPIRNQGVMVGRSFLCSASLRATVIPEPHTRLPSKERSKSATLAYEPLHVGSRGVTRKRRRGAN
jgi:hypothetical protein